MTEILNYVPRVAKDLGLYEWTKKLGQQHWSVPGSYSGTLCGMPMLGNNYAKHIDEEDKTPCPQCAHQAQLYRLDESA